MATRSRRLGKLMVLQGKLKALHETRQAGHMAASIKAREEAEDLRRRADMADSFASIFPDLYRKHISDALARSESEDRKAAEEAKLVATATLRMKRVGEAFRAARADEERQSEEREQLELVQRQAAEK